MEVLRRIGLVSLMVMLVASMLAVSALTGSAQDSGQYDGDAGQYDTDEPGQYEPEDSPPAPDGDDVVYCAPEWLREWGQSQGWWYFWWYKWCHQGSNSWFKAYDGWEWWGPVE